MSTIYAKSTDNECKKKKRQHDFGYEMPIKKQLLDVKISCIRMEMCIHVNSHVCRAHTCIHSIALSPSCSAGADFLSKKLSNDARVFVNRNLST